MQAKSWLEQLQRQLMLLHRDVSRLWAHKDFKRLGFLTLHYIGFIGYVLITFYACITFGFALWVGGFIVGDLKSSGLFRKSREDEFPNVFYWLLCALLYVLMGLYRLFAGFMGWGSKQTKPARVLWVMLHAIPNRLAPNNLTVVLSIPTLLGVAWAFIVYVIAPVVS